MALWHKWHKLCLWHYSLSRAYDSRIASAKRNDEKTGQLNFFDMLNVYPANSMPNMVKEADNCE